MGRLGTPLLIGFLLLIASLSHADTWDDRFGLQGFPDEPTDGRIRDLVVVDGDLYAAGDFTTIGGVSTSHVARWNGSAWSAVGNVTLDGSVFRLIEHNGAIAAAGNLNYVNGQPGEIAVWDGLAWTALHDGSLENVIIAMESDGTSLYVLFTGGQVVLKWDGSNGSVIGTPAGGYVEDLLWWNGDLYATGEFYSISAVAAQNVARWDGSQWHPIGSGIPNTSWKPFVHDNRLYVRASCYTDALWSWTGAQWNTVVSTCAACPIRGTGALFFQGRPYFSGVCGTPSGTQLPGVAVWDGVTWETLDGGVYDPATNNISFAPAAGPLVEYQGRLLMGGTFTVAGGMPAQSHLALWDGERWYANAPDDRVRAFTISGPDIFLGGDFTQVFETPASHVARWDGSDWHALGIGVNGTVHAMVMMGNDLYVGGEFTDAGGSGAASLAKWNGSTWSAVGLPLSGAVYALATDGTNLYAGGNFLALQTELLQRIARWDGNAWHAMGGGFTNSGSVRALAVDGTIIYAAGDFAYANHAPVGNVARWDGSTWNTMAFGFDDGAVRALEFHGGVLYAGGDFTKAGNVTMNRMAWWDGTMWNQVGEPFNPGVDAPVRALASSGGSLFAAGAFTSAGGTPANRIVSWDGSTWHAMGGGLDQPVDALAMGADELFVGGEFATADGLGSHRIARWSLTPTAVVSTPGPRTPILEPAIPNPFNPSTRIRYQVPRDMHVTIVIYDVAGRRVRMLVDEFTTTSPGMRTMEWDGGSDKGGRVASGVFFVRMSAGSVVQTQKIVLLK